MQARSLHYRNVLRKELSCASTSSGAIHLVGYSLSGPLSLMLANALDEDKQQCRTLSLIDPAPFWGVTENLDARNYL